MARSRTNNTCPACANCARSHRRASSGASSAFGSSSAGGVFDGVDEPCQRPSWNYRKVGGGGLLVDMYPHFRYLIEGLLGPIRRVFTAATTAMPERLDEAVAPYAGDVEDHATTLIELQSWAAGVTV